MSGEGEVLRVGVLVSGSGTNLQALLDGVHGREALIVGVGSSVAGVRALERAAAAGVPGRVFGRDDFQSREARDLAIADWLGDLGVGLVVLAGYMQLLTPPFLDRFGGAVINVHPSLLPAFPGVRAIEQALAAGVRRTGVTVHFVDEGVDTGPVIAQRELEFEPGISAEDLHDRLRPLEHELLSEAVRRFATGELSATASEQGRS